MKKFVAPLQAFALLLLCSGMGWMVFVLASINPNPPSYADLQARNTQDLSFTNMNSTAVALAREMLAEMVPSPSGPIFLPVTGRETATPSPVAVVTLKAVSTFWNTPTPSSSVSNLIPSTPTRKKQDKPTSTARPTLAPTNTPPPPTQTAAVTNSPIPTSQPPTNIPPTVVTTEPTTPPATPSEPTIEVPINTPQTPEQPPIVTSEPVVITTEPTKVTP